MSHEYRILSGMLIRGEISLDEYHEMVDKSDKEFEKLKDKFLSNEITLDDYIREYNKLIEQAKQPFGPPSLHEHI